MPDAPCRRSSRTVRGMHDGRPHTELSHEIDQIVERLEEQFCEIEPEIVADVVHQCAAAFADARIKTFVPLLAEKRAREKLRACRSERRKSLLKTDERRERVTDLSEALFDVVDRPVGRTEVGVVELVPVDRY